MPGPKAVLEQLFFLSAKPDHFVYRELKCADLSCRKTWIQGNRPGSVVLCKRQIYKILVWCWMPHMTPSVSPLHWKLLISAGLCLPMMCRECLDNKPTHMWESETKNVSGILCLQDGKVTCRAWRFCSRVDQNYLCSWIYLNDGRASQLLGVPFVLTKFC